MNSSIDYILGNIEGKLTKLDSIVGSLEKYVKEIEHDLAKLTNQVDNHPIGCPLNSEKIERMIDDKIVIYEAKLPERKLSTNVNKVNIAFMVFIALLTFLSTYIAYSSWQQSKANNTEIIRNKESESAMKKLNEHLLLENKNEPNKNN